MSRSERVPEALLGQVIKVFEPIRVILFGSRAYGVASEDSDYDLLVVVPDDAPPTHFAVEARRRARQVYRRAADIIPCRQSIFETKSRIPGSLAYTAAQHGVVVYER